jgi:ribokinase
MPAPRRVCVIGSINMDLVVRAPRFPSPGETILGGAFATSPGGKGANQAVAAARMGARVSMIGRVGEDAYGVEMRRILDNEGIDTTAVLTTKSTPTGVAVITVAEDAGNTIVVAPGANAVVTPADVEAARNKIEAADVVLMQLEVPLETIEAAARLARSLDKTVVLNAAPAQPLPPSLLALLNVLIVNETEGELLARDARLSPLEPEHAPSHIAPLLPLFARLVSLGVPNTVATLGAHGAAWLHDRKCHPIDPFPVTPVDTVGAGDAFCGTLAATWSAAGPLDALRTASAAGALATTKPGAIPSLPSTADVRALMARDAR